jgi:hypothetical protein
MFKRRFKSTNPWTDDQYAMLSKDSLESMVPTLETCTLQRMEAKLESKGSLSEAQQCLDRAIFWELYNRENAAREQKKWVTPNDNDVQAADHDRIRSVHAKQLGIKKQLHIKDKQQLIREAMVAQKHEHWSGCKQKKPRNASSHNVDVVDPDDVLCDVRAEHDVECEQLYMLEILMAENSDPWKPMNPILGHLWISTRA